MPLGKAYNSFLIPKRFTQIRIPAARVLTLFTTPLEIVTAEPGYIIYPRSALFTKEAGAFTVAGVTQVGVKYPSGGFMIGVSPAGEVLSAAGQTASLGNLVSTVANFFDNIAPATINVALSVVIGGANPAGTGADLTVALFYELWPIKFGFS